MRREWPRGQRTDRNDQQVVCEVHFHTLTRRIGNAWRDRRPGTECYGGRRPQGTTRAISRSSFPKDPTLFPDALHPNSIDSICQNLAKADRRGRRKLSAPAAHGPRPRPLDFAAECPRRVTWRADDPHRQTHPRPGAPPHRGIHRAARAGPYQVDGRRAVHLRHPRPATALSWIRTYPASRFRGSHRIRSTDSSIAPAAEGYTSRRRACRCRPVLRPSEVDLGEPALFDLPPVLGALRS